MLFLSAAVLPSNFAMLLLLAGIVVLFVRRLRRFAIPVLIGAGSCVLVFSSGWVAAALLSPLEYAYPAMQDPARHPEAHDIVALTGYAAEDDSMPLSSRANSSSLYRVVEALEIYRRCDQCRVIVSGSQPTAKIMGEVMVSLGVPKERLVIDGESMNTAASARAVHDLVGGKPFFLVTSAGHLPRTMAAFRKVGVVSAIPAPTDYQLPRNVRRASILPSPMNLYASDLAIHEYVGMAWYRLVGRI